MSIIIDKCFLLDNQTTNSLSLKSGRDTMIFQLRSSHPIIMDLSYDVMYKFHLNKVGESIYVITKIEELIDDYEDFAEPDEIDTIEIKKSLLNTIDDAILLKKKSLQHLKSIQIKLQSKNASVQSVEDAYNEFNEFNECIWKK